MLAPGEEGYAEGDYVDDEDLLVNDPRAPIEVPPKNHMSHMQPDNMTSVSQMSGSKSFISNL